VVLVIINGILFLKNLLVMCHKGEKLRRVFRNRFVRLPAQITTKKLDGWLLGDTHQASAPIDHRADWLMLG
jgi:hypothetical protein